ncbi:MAG: TenA family protein [Chloroflexi bacterium]|nr:TenA family protein [Chloroflexota bacterium]
MAEHREAWERVVRHPFVLELGAGTLPRPAFAAYMAQDYLFVDALARTVAYGIAKAPSAVEARPLSAFLQTLLGAEDDLFGRVFDELGMPPPAERRPEPLPVTARFGRFMEGVGRRGTFEEIATALYVTEGTYADWASRLVAEGRRPDDALYQSWIDIHADPALAELVAHLGRWIDAAPAEREPALSNVFRRALRHEVAFWNAFVPTRTKMREGGHG